MAKSKTPSLLAKLKIKKKKGTITKAEEKKLKQLLISNIPGVKYKGSGKDPAVNELLKKLKKGGADSLDSSGMGTRWKV
tara:strand:- start:618 stop:854 length:237 start_codon:yes stop_codon:yes gene_type:complete